MSRDVHIAESAAQIGVTSLQILDALLVEALDRASRLGLDFAAIRIEEALLIARERAITTDTAGWNGLPLLN